MNRLKKPACFVVLVVAASVQAQPALTRTDPVAVSGPLVAAPIVPPSATVKSASTGPSIAAQVVELVNQQRLVNGNLPPLKHVDLLDNAAQLHSDNMAGRDFFAHCDLDTKTEPWDRMSAAGYNWHSAAENIAAGQTTPAAVMTGWMNSTGHRSNILSSSYWEIGVGYTEQVNDMANIRSDAGNCTSSNAVNGPYYRYWTQNFGRRSGYPLVIEREAYSTSSRDVALYIYGSGWAQEMRLQNEDGVWSAWQSYATALNWSLTAGNGSKTVTVELRNGGTVRSASDSIELTGQTDPEPGGEPLFQDGFEN